MNAYSSLCSAAVAKFRAGFETYSHEARSRSMGLERVYCKLLEVHNPSALTQLESATTSGLFSCIFSQATEFTMFFYEASRYLAISATGLGKFFELESM